VVVFESVMNGIAIVFSFTKSTRDVKTTPTLTVPP